MTPYSEYKPTNVEWLADIPAHWVTIKLKLMTELRGRIGWRGLTTEDYVDDGIILLGVRNISSGGFLTLDKVSRIPEVKYDESPEIKVQVGDVLLAKTGATIGKTCVVEALPEPMTVNAAVNIFRVKNNTIPKFLHFLLQSEIYQTILWSSVSENAQGNLFQRDIKEVWGILPTLSEQQAISSYLDNKTALIDETIKKKQQLIELLQEERIALINRAVTKGIDDTVSLRPSGIEWIGDLPKEWKSVRLKYVVTCNNEILTETTNPETEMKYVEISDVQSGKGIVNYTVVKFKDAPSRARRIVKDGDVIVSTVRTYLKAIARVKNPESSLIVSTGFAVLSPTNIYSNFLGYLFESRLIEEVVKRSSGVSYPAINASELTEINVPLPPSSSQQLIVAFLDKKTGHIDATIRLAQRQINLLQEYRTALINETVTGRVRVI